MVSGRLWSERGRPGDSVWPRRKAELDRAFDGRINDGQDYLPRLDGLLKMEEEDESLVEWIPIEVLGRVGSLI